MSNDKDVELENENNDVDSNYQPPPQKTIEEMVNADQEDESLRKYKEALLGICNFLILISLSPIVSEFIYLKFIKKIRSSTI